MSHEIELLIEIRDLLQVIAEPALAKRDARLRTALRGAVGKSAKRVKAVLLMDGTRSQAALAKDSGADKGDLSRLVKRLAVEQLISADQKHPRVLVKVPSHFFDGNDANE
jgi:DNA-binding MarR family transcriptional regulator